MKERINMSDFEIERWFSMNEICDHLGIKRDTALKSILNKNMPARTIGKGDCYE